MKKAKKDARQLKAYNKAKTQAMQHYSNIDYSKSVVKIFESLGLYDYRNGPVRHKVVKKITSNQELIDIYDISQLEDIKPNKRYVMHITFTLGMFEGYARKLSGTEGCTFVTENGVEIPTHMNY